MDYTFIAKAMCDLTLTELWEPRLAWAKNRDPSVSLEVRVGTGKRTYVSHSHHLKGPMKLVYGKKMVQSKADPRQLCAWLSAREIVDRGYFGGEVNLLNSLSHTIVHEFGHVVQVLTGQRYAGSVHNPGFYAILDKAHGNGHAERLRNMLHERCLSRGIDLTVVANPSPALAADDSGLSLADLVVGKEMQLTGRFSQYSPVVVIEKKRKYAIVKCMSGPQMFKVGPRHLRHLNGSN